MKAILILGFVTVCSNNLFAHDYKSLDATPAHYEVPVSEELKEYAFFELVDLEKTINGDKMIVEYSLPDILTGNVEHY
ncbi:MAG: hypothetical protein H7336_11565 [Bacteriovorax sp.]|nr:hypothetical protein [Bacteriovorax sp.]